MLSVLSYDYLHIFLPFPSPASTQKLAIGVFRPMPNGRFLLVTSVTTATFHLETPAPSFVSGLLPPPAALVFSDSVKIKRNWSILVYMSCSFQFDIAEGFTYIYSTL